MAQREILSGAVLDVAQSATDAAFESLARTQAELTATALRVKDERDQALKLLQRTLEMREIGEEGWHKTNIRAFLNRIGVPVFIARPARQQSLEREIVAFNPDAREAIELIHALQRALEDRFGEKAIDAYDLLGQACTALEELE